MPPHRPPETSKIPLWLDCDPGHDDAFAILLAAHHPSLHLLGLSTIHGNASLAATTLNATRILTAIARTDVPVYPGASRPSGRAEAVYAPDIHGPTGLDGTTLLPDHTVPARSDVDAVDAMRAALLAEAAGAPWLVATGALTNVAALFARFPEVAGHIRGLSIMGGAVGGGFTGAVMGRVGEFDDGMDERVGNVTRWAEFNIYCDPEAARSVLTHPVLAPKTTLVPLDLTHQVLATPAVLRRLLQNPTSTSPSPSPSCSSFPSPFCSTSTLTSTSTSALTHTTPLPPTAPPPAPSTLRLLLHDLLTFFAHTYARVFGFVLGPPLHDPLAVAVLLWGMDNDHDHVHNHVHDGADVAGTGCGVRGVEFDDRGGERWVVDVVVEGEGGEVDGERYGDGDGDGDWDGAGEGRGQVGRTVVTRVSANGSASGVGSGCGSAGTVQGVRIPRAVDVEAFWAVLEGCVERAERAGMGMGMRPRAERGLGTGTGEERGKQRVAA